MFAGVGYNSPPRRQMMMVMVRSLCYLLSPLGTMNLTTIPPFHRTQILPSPSMMKGLDGRTVREPSTMKGWERETVGGGGVGSGVWAV